MHVRNILLLSAVLIIFSITNYAEAQSDTKVLGLDMIPFMIDTRDMTVFSGILGTESRYIIPDATVYKDNVSFGSDNMILRFVMDNYGIFYNEWTVLDRYEDLWDFTMFGGNQYITNESTTFSIKASATNDTSVNTVPVAVDDAATVSQDDSVVIHVLNNDSDGDGDTLSITGTSVPTNGAVAINEETVTYTPDSEYYGTDSFTYTVSDGTDTDTATVTVTVTSVNDAPVAVDDTATVQEDNSVTISVLDNDSDGDGDTLSITGTSVPTNGAITINEETITYTPDSEYYGTDSFTYTVSDGTDTNTATVTVTVTAVNDAPVSEAGDDLTVNEGTTVTLDGTDSVDVDGDTLGYLWSQTDGTVVTISDDTVASPTFTAPEVTESEMLTFELSVTDGTLYNTDTVTVTVNNIIPANSAPVAVDDTATVQEDNSVTISVLDNDSDGDGDALSITGTSVPTNGAITINEETITYTPDSEYYGTDSFTYTVSDGTDTNTATVTVTVTAVNDAPVSEAGDNLTVNEGTTVTLDGTGSADVDGDTLGYLWSQTDGTVVTISDDTVASPTFTAPEVTESEMLTFELSVTDGTLYNTDTVTVTVNNISLDNTVPVAVDDTATVQEDNSVTISVLDNDSDGDGDALTITGTSVPANGAVAINEETVTYTPDANFNGVNSFTYTVSDGTDTNTATVTVTVTAVNDAPVSEAGDDLTVNEGTTVTLDGTDSVDVDGDTLGYLWSQTDGTVVTISDDTVASPTFTAPEVTESEMLTFELSVTDGTLYNTDTVTVTVNNISLDNTVPVAVDDTATVQEDNSVTISVLNNDSDGDGDTLSITGTSVSTNGAVAINEETVTYTPDSEYYGTDSFTYTVSDGTDTNTATVTVTVTAVNDAPVSEAGDDLTVNEGTTVTLDGTDSVDVDGDTLGYLWSQTDGTVVTISDDTVASPTFTAPEVTESEMLTFELSVTDGTLYGTDTVTVTVSDIQVDSAPVAVDDMATVQEDNSVTISVLNNDSDGDGDALTITGTSVPANGTVTIDSRTNSIMYMPNTNYNGVDSFTYTVSNNNYTDTATVTVTITPINDSPIANAGNDMTINEGVTVTLDATDSIDVDGDALFYSWNQTSGTAIILSDDTVVSPTFTAPEVEESKVLTFELSVTDGALYDTDTVSIMVNDAIPTNTTPVAADDTATVFENGLVMISVLDNDYDVDGDALNITEVTQPSNGTAWINSGANVTYTPDSDYYGTDSFTYVISDGTDTTTATVNVSVSQNQDTYTSVLTLDPISSEIIAGDTVVFTGLLGTESGYVVPGATIYIKDDVDFWIDDYVLTLVTDDGGRFYGEWAAKMRLTGGAYDFYAIYDGDSQVIGDKSATYSVEVIPYQETQSILTLDPISSEIIAGDTVVFTGLLGTESGYVVPGATIYIKR